MSYIISGGWGNGRAVSLSLYNHNFLSGFFSNENGAVRAQSINVHDLLYDGGWHHVKVVLDREDHNRIKLYLDGHQVNSDEKRFDGGPIYGSDGQFGFVIGHLTPWFLRDGTESGFRGWIDEVRISKVARVKPAFAPPATLLTPPDAIGGETQIERFGHALAMAGPTMVIGAHHDNTGLRGSAYVGEAPDRFDALKRLDPGPLPAAARFGYAVAVNRQRQLIAVSAPGGSSTLPGNVYVFTYDAAQETCALETVLDAAAGGQQFGWSVALDGDILAVGDPELELVSGAFTMGAVYIYQRDASNGAWNHIQTVDAATAGMVSVPGARLGHSVALQGDRLLIGAPRDNSFRGAAYLFTNSGSNENPWVLSHQFTAADNASGERFGHAVALDGDRIVVGTQVQVLSAGRTYIYEPDSLAPNGWLETRLEGVPGDQFGYAVAIDGATVAVGAPGRSSNDGDTVYIYCRNGVGSWEELTQLSPNAADKPNDFGKAVALYGNTLAVGDPGFDLPDVQPGRGAGNAGRTHLYHSS
ncbi:LamG-like jellyroll fold domain-containing protein [Candidatus Entotheonella palauensis]|uniref:LamG-like jellyroll fold domain-containing protein n=1 Tax=Candidatus Entotheonella palauensis TaxID=93172 RepID=UPI000B7F9842|nr:LamG-like jellyroll fold domain-containing protein [Candidatus Entotheonella palauensis]